MFLKNSTLQTSPRLNLQRPSFYIIAILCLGLGLRLAGLTKGIWLDEYSSLEKIQGSLLLKMSVYDHPPLYFVFLKLWTYINTSEPFLRVFSVIWGMGTIIVVIKWIGTYSPLAGIVSGIYCAFTPVMLRFSQEIRGYSLLLFATALSFYFASRIINKPQQASGYIGLAVSLSAGVATHLVGVFLLPTLFLFLVLSMTWPQKLQVVKIMLTLVVPGIIFIWVFFFFMPPEVRARTAETWWMPQVSLYQVGQVAVADLLGASSLDWSFSILRNYGMVVAVPVMALLFLVFLFFAGSLLAGDWRRSYPLFIASISYCLLLIGYSVVKVPVFGERTALPAIIPLIGFMGVQISTINVLKLQRLSIAALMVICLNTTLNWIGYKAWRPVEPTRDVAHELKQRKKSQDKVIFFPAYFAGPIRYYYPELPFEDEIRLEVPAKNDDLEALKKIVQDSSPANVFLVVRHDMTVKKYSTTYQKLRKVLAFAVGPPDVTQRFDVLSITRYRAQEGQHFKK